MKPNQRVAVEVTLDDVPTRFPSRIEDVTADCLVLAGPTERGQPLRLAAGTTVRVILFMDGGVHAFESVVVDCHLFPVAMLHVRRPQRIVALQRRKFFREPAVIRTLCSRGGDETELSIEGWTRNLSGGGFSLRTTQVTQLQHLVEASDPDDPLWIEVQLPDHPLRALAVMCWWQINEADGVADLAFEFLDLADAERERLIRYIFTLQRNALKRGVA